MTRPLISDATMFAAEGGMTDIPQLPREASAERYDALLNRRDAFDPREAPSPMWWKAVLVGVMAAAFWAGVVL